MTMIYEMIRELMSGYLFEAHDSMKVRRLAGEKRLTWRKTTLFWESLVLISSARRMGVTASDDGYQNHRAAFGRCRGLRSSAVRLFHL